MSEGGGILHKSASAFYGYVVSAFVPPFVMGTGLVWLDKWSLSAAIPWAAFLTLPSAFFSFMLGAPIFAVLDNYKIANGLTLPVTGFFAGGLVLVIITLPTLSLLTMQSICLYGLMGALTALVFWSIWRLGR